ncbi:MAG: phytanoyl-CoA dioxygenase family protein [Pseudoclavibacter sp.]
MHYQDFEREKAIMTTVLRESSPSDSTAKLRENLATDGYLFFRDLLPRTIMSTVASELRERFNRGGWIRDDGSARSRAAVADQGSDETYQWAVKSESFHRVPYIVELREIVRKLYGQPCFPYPSKVLRATPPAAWATESGRYAHRDYAYWGIDDMLTTWVPLMDIPRELGGLAVRTGSHREGPVPLEVLKLDDPGWATVDYHLGDVLIFHCLTSHAALPNATSSLRISGDYRWQPVSTSVPADLVFGSKRSTKELFHRSFSEKDWWSPVPENVEMRDSEIDRSTRPGASIFFELNNSPRGFHL